MAGIQVVGKAGGELLEGIEADVHAHHTDDFALVQQRYGDAAHQRLLAFDLDRVGLCHAGAPLGLRADVPGVGRLATRRCRVGADLGFAEHLLHQIAGLALRPVQGKATFFIAGQITLASETDIFTDQRVGKQYHVEAEDFFAILKGLAGHGDQVPAQLPRRQSPVPRLGAQLQDLLGKTFPIDRRFAEKAFHPLTMGHGL
ncbi:hypothetical protein D3C84_755330 [compost metagenome]